MKIMIASDAVGADLKDVVKQHLIERGYDVCDKSGEKDAPLPYPVVGDLVAKDVQNGVVERGIVFCGSGMGVSIVANKHKGIYCAVVEGVFSAYSSREINNVNMLALGGGLIGKNLALKIVDTFLETEWLENADEVRAKRLASFMDMLYAIEEEQFC